MLTNFNLEIYFHTEIKTNFFVRVPPPKHFSDLSKINKLYCLQNKLLIHFNINYQ